MFDILIRNALIVDGTGKAGYPGEVAVSDGKIAAICIRSPQSLENTGHLP